MSNKYPEIEEKMNKAISVLNEQLHTLRAGRANAAVLDKIRVEYYGSMSKISEVAAISVPEPRMLVIQPWGRFADKRNRKGNSDLRYRYKSRK